MRWRGCAACGPWCRKMSMEQNRGNRRSGGRDTLTLFSCAQWLLPLVSSSGAPQRREASIEGRGKGQQGELGCSLLVGKASEAARDTGA